MDGINYLTSSLKTYPFSERDQIKEIWVLTDIVEANQYNNININPDTRENNATNESNAETTTPQHKENKM
jgi:hypothetical protein